MKQLIPLLGLLALPFCLQGQAPFTRGWEIWCEYQQNNMEQTADGGYIICTDAVPEMDTVNNLAWCYLIKLDANGNQQWIKQFAKSNYFVKAYDGNSVCQTSDGGYAIATVMYTGSASSFSSHTAIYMVRTDPSGNLLWAKTFPGAGNSSASCIRENSDHGFVVAGTTTDTLLNLTYAYLLRTDSIGGVTWGTCYWPLNQSPTGSFTSATQTSDGGFIVAGEMNGEIVMKTDGAGNVTWTQGNASVGAVNNDVQAVSYGGYIATGTDYAEPFLATLTRYSASGMPLWRKTYSSTDHSNSSGDQSFSVEEVPGGFVLATNDPGTAKTRLTRTDTSGNTIWMRQYNQTYAFMPVDLEFTSTGDLAFVASFYDFLATTVSWKIMIFKTTGSGIAACEDSLVSDTSATVSIPLPKPVSTMSIAPSANLPTIIYPVVMADTNFCPGNPKGIDEVLPVIGVSIYPNPANDQVQVQLNGLTGNEVNVRMINSLGQEVAGTSKENTQGLWTTSVSTLGLPVGMYFVCIEIDGEMYRTEKLTIQR